MIGAKKKYGSVQAAMNTWRDYMVSMDLVILGSRPSG